MDDFNVTSPKNAIFNERLVSPDLCDPITRKVMADPVITPHGDTFERRHIVSLLEKRPVCPLTGKPLHADQLLPNRALKNFINSNPEAHYFARRNELLPVTNLVAEKGPAGPATRAPQGLPPPVPEEVAAQGLPAPRAAASASTQPQAAAANELSHLGPDVSDECARDLTAIMEEVRAARWGWENSAKQKTRALVWKVVCAGRIDYNVAMAELNPTNTVPLRPIGASTKDYLGLRTKELREQATSRSQMEAFELWAKAVLELSPEIQKSSAVNPASYAGCLDLTYAWGIAFSEASEKCAFRLRPHRIMHLALEASRVQRDLGRDYGYTHPPTIETMPADHVVPTIDGPQLSAAEFAAALQIAIDSAPTSGKKRQAWSEATQKQMRGLYQAAIKTNSFDWVTALRPLSPGHLPLRKSERELKHDISRKQTGAIAEQARLRTMMDVALVCGACLDFALLRKTVTTGLWWALDHTDRLLERYVESAKGASTTERKPLERRLLSLDREQAEFYSRYRLPAGARLNVREQIRPIAKERESLIA